MWASASSALVPTEAHKPPPVPVSLLPADEVVSLAHATPIIAKTATTASAARVRRFRMDPSFSQGPPSAAPRTARTIGPLLDPSNAARVAAFPRHPACTLWAAGRDGGTGRRAGLKIP